MWYLVLVCLETVLCRCKIGAQFVPNVRLAQELFWTNQMVLLGDEAQVEHLSVHLGDSANLNTR
jgi:hypothetical protein